MHIVIFYALTNVTWFFIMLSYFHYTEWFRDVEWFALRRNLYQAEFVQR